MCWREREVREDRDSKTPAPRETRELWERSRLVREERPVREPGVREDSWLLLRLREVRECWREKLCSWTREILLADRSRLTSSV